MSLKTILTEPNKLLRQISQPVEIVGDSKPTKMWVSHLMEKSNTQNF